MTTPPKTREDAKNRIAEIRFLMKRREVETGGKGNEEDAMSFEVVNDLMASYDFLLREYERA